MYGLNQIAQQQRIHGAGAAMNPAFANLTTLDRDTASGACLGGTAPRSPLGEAADALDQRLQQLQGTIFRLGDRLAPVLLPPTPATQGEPVCANASAPVVDTMNAASGMLCNMQRQLDAIIERLAV